MKGGLWGLQYQKDKIASIKKVSKVPPHKACHLTILHRAEGVRGTGYGNNTE